jgi:hypothetical protein
MYCRIFVSLFLATCCLANPAAAQDPFRDHVAPLLKQRCVSCHNTRKTKGGLNLTTREYLLRGGDHGPAIVPGKANQSLLLELVNGPKPRMPRQGTKLAPGELAGLRQWIDQGAPWPQKVVLEDSDPGSKSGADWWAFRKLTFPVLPSVRNQSWVRTPIDAFILAALEAKGLSPAAPAERRTLIRRVSYDLHGLPPTPEDVQAFVHDADPQAYEKLIDRLLASSRYGERWGRHWLDVVHYGDTHGYDKDKRRDQAWPYRDYVIRAFNQDKTYGQFVREQLAGDILAPQDPDSVMATGFIAAGPWDFVGHVELREGTVDKEKTRLLDRDDMVSNTMSTFVSLTVHCARCHDHKFDPIPQKDYYRLQAVFAGVDRANRPYASPPQLDQRIAFEKQQQAIVARRAALVKQAEQAAGAELVELDQGIARLQKNLEAIPLPGTSEASPSNGYHSAISSNADVLKWVQVDLGRSVSIDQIRLIPARPVDFPDTPGFGFPVRFRVELAEDPSFVRSEIIADQSQADYPNPGDHPVLISPVSKKARYVRVTAQRLWLRSNDYAFALAELQVDSGGKNAALGAPVAALDSIEGGLWSMKYLVDNYDSRHLLPDLSDRRVLSLVQERSARQDRLAQMQQDRQRLAAAHVDTETRRELDRLAAESADLARKVQSLAGPPMVYAVVSHPARPIHVLTRGDVEKPGPLVVAGSLHCVPGLDPDFLPATQEPEGRRRLALAEWIADPRNVLTWRSIVNRVWHYHFGRGLVDTPNDFGANGGRPSHPELLDWLAAYFLTSGQSIKELHRIILLSAVYRESSEDNAAFARIDGDDRLLWRMNRQRLDAEELRDSILAVSGSLDVRMAGPGFELFRFKDDHSPVYDHEARDKINNPASWRRTVYRFTVRSVPNPFLECLDCADPNINTPVRNTTLTALQALALLNDPFLLKQSELFARRLERQTADRNGRIDLAYQLALARSPTTEEREALAAFAERHGLAPACRLLLNTSEFVFID